MAGQDGTAMRVYSMMKLVFDIFEAAGHFRRFPLRKMQCLFLAVGKKSIILDMIFQRGAEQ